VFGGSEGRDEVEATWACAAFWSADDPSTVPKRRLSQVFIPLCMRCSSRTCILTSASISSVSFPMRFRAFVRMLPNALKSLSHDAEFGQMAKMWRASRMIGIACSCGWSTTSNESNNLQGFGDSPWKQYQLPWFAVAKLITSCSEIVRHAMTDMRSGEKSPVSLK
jgi:hypothetical protein